MNSEKYVEEKLKSIYKRSFIIAGISLILFVVFPFIFHENADFLLLFPISGFVISIIFGYNIWSNTKKSKIIKALMLLVVIAAIIGIHFAYMKIIGGGQVGLERVDIDEGAMRQYNARFTEFEGQTNVKGTDIKALIREVIIHNVSVDPDTSLLIMVEYGTELSDTYFTIPEKATQNAVNKNAKNVLGLIENGKTYKVTCQYDNRTGYVTRIAINQTN